MKKMNRLVVSLLTQWGKLSNLDSSIDQLDMPSYDELSHVSDELHYDFSLHETKALHWKSLYSQKKLRH